MCEVRRHAVERPALLDLIDRRSERRPVDVPEPVEMAAARHDVRRRDRVQAEQLALQCRVVVVNHRRPVVVDNRVGVERRLAAGAVAIERHAGLRAHVVSGRTGVRIETGCTRAVGQLRRRTDQVDRKDPEVRVGERAGARAETAPRRVRRVNELEIGQVVGQGIAGREARSPVAHDIPRQPGARPEVVARVVQRIDPLPDAHQLAETGDELGSDIVRLSYRPVHVVAQPAADRHARRELPFVVEEGPERRLTEIP